MHSSFLFPRLSHSQQLSLLSSKRGVQYNVLNRWGSMMMSTCSDFAAGRAMLLQISTWSSYLYLLARERAWSSRYISWFMSALPSSLYRTMVAVGGRARSETEKSDSRSQPKYLHCRARRILQLTSQNPFQKNRRDHTIIYTTLPTTSLSIASQNYPLHPQRQRNRRQSVSFTPRCRYPTRGYIYLAPSATLHLPSAAM